MPFPTEIPEWDTNDTNSAPAPPQQIKDDGLPEGVPLPFSYLNWILSRLATFAAWFLAGKLWSTSGQSAGSVVEDTIDYFVVPAGSLSDDTGIHVRTVVRVIQNLAAADLTVRLRFGLDSDPMTSRHVLATWSLTNPNAGDVVTINATLHFDSGVTELWALVESNEGAPASPTPRVQIAGTFGIGLVVDGSVLQRANITAEWSAGIPGNGGTEISVGQAWIR